MAQDERDEFDNYLAAYVLRQVDNPLPPPQHQQQQQQQPDRLAPPVNINGFAAPIFLGGHVQAPPDGLAPPVNIHGLMPHPAPVPRPVGNAPFPPGGNGPFPPGGNVPFHAGGNAPFPPRGIAPPPPAQPHQNPFLANVPPAGLGLNLDPFRPAPPPAAIPPRPLVQVAPFAPAAPPRPPPPVDHAMHGNDVAVGRRLLESDVADMINMFPNVDEDWLRETYSNMGLEDTVEFVLSNMDSEHVPKRRKRRIEVVDGPHNSDSPPLKIFRPLDMDGRVWPAGTDQMRDTMRSMSDVERASHSLMIDDMINEARPHVRLNRCHVPLPVAEVKDGQILTKLTSVYSMVRVPFLRALVNCLQGDSAKLLLVLELLRMGEEDRIHSENLLPKEMDRHHRPHTKPLTTKQYNKILLDNLDPNFKWNNPYTSNMPQDNPFNSLAVAWDQLTVLAKKDRSDSIEHFECSVCFEKYITANAVKCSTDDISAEVHSFCRECVVGQAQACCDGGSVVAGGIGVPCLESGCKGHFPISSLRPVLGGTLFHRLEKRVEQEALSSSDLVVERCKYCSFGISFDVPKEVNKVFSCTECRAEFCRNCLKDWGPHMGLRCDEMVSAEETNRKKLEEELTAAMIRTCPKCNMNFEKEDGCNKMTCRCGTTQCYVCRQTNIDYSHFCSCFRDPNSNREDRTNCKCKGSCLLWVEVRREMEKQRADILRRAEDLLDGQTFSSLKK